jgi:hypothetical protein
MIDILEEDLDKDDEDYDLGQDLIPASSVQARKKTSSKGGRGKDPVWEQFTEDADGFTTCKQCNWRIKHAKPDRLRVHLEGKCGKKRKAFTNTVSAPAEVVSEPGSIAFLNPPTKQAKLDSFFIATSVAQKKEFDKKLEKFVCSSNIAFRTVEDPYFVDFIKALRPSYMLPSRKIVGSKLLNELYEECEETTIKKLRGKTATIMQDGWTTNQHEAVIAHSLFVNNEVIFIEAIVAEEAKKDAENCFIWIENCIKSSEEKYGVKITGCITDNCRTMEAMRKRLQEAYPEIICYGCNSHLCNLCGKKLTPTELKDKIVDVQKYFRNHDFASGALIKLKGLRPVIPGDTRWNSQLDCFRCYLKNQAKYLEISRRDNLMPETIKQTLGDPTIFTQLEGALNVLEPIGISLDVVRKFIGTDTMIWH